MTTSWISHLPDASNGFDVQALKDYALEAPWEWRKLLNQLIELAEEFAEAELGGEVAKEKVEELTSAGADAVKEISEQLEGFLAMVRSKKAQPTAVEINEFEMTVRKSLEDLEKAAL